MRKEIQNPKAAVHLLAAGTITNIVCLRSMTLCYESVIACKDAHICKHETGGPEAVGIKINTIDSDDGKITPDQI